MKCTPSAPGCLARLGLLLAVLLSLAFTTFVWEPVAAAPKSSSSPGTPEQAIERAWEAARDVGAYQFASDVAEVTYPAR